MFTFAVVLYIFNAFNEVWCRAREHRKLRHFNTTKKTRENTRLLYELSVILYFRHVFDMFFHVFSTVKRVNFDHAEKQVNYSDKLRRLFAPRNPSATELHFVYLFCTFYQDLSSFVGAKRQR